MINQFNTPILFLIFNRPDTTQVVFNAIKKIKPKYLFIAADGPRSGNESDKEKCKEARNIIKQIDWDCEVKTLFKDENLGCGKAESKAMNWFFENVEEGIILEDDCLPTDSFFMFCQLMLEKYRNNNHVGSISGTNYLFGYHDYEYSYYFSKHAYFWGWATWRRVWNLYNFNDSIFPNKFYLRKYFNNSLSYDYYLDMFENFKYNNIDTWDVQMNATLITNKLYQIIPISNQISNIGINGTHNSKHISSSIKMSIKNIDFKNMKYHSDLLYDKNLDLISINNIVYKVNNDSKIKILIRKIIGRKNINLLKRIYNYI